MLARLQNNGEHLTWSKKYSIIIIEKERRTNAWDLTCSLCKRVIERYLDSFWKEYIDATDIEDFEYNKTAIVYYWRKFWDLHTFISNKKGRLDNGEWCEITRENLEDMIEFATHNKDY